MNDYKPTILNLKTGETRLVDSEKIRITRMGRRIHAWSEAVKEIEAKNQVRKVMVTLTYDTRGTLGEPATWQANHIRDCVKALKRKLGKGLLACAWVAEMQKRGVPHYHLYMIVRTGTDIPKPDVSRMWPWGLSRIETGRSPFYLAAYLKQKGQEKAYQKQGYPKGMRIFAVWLRKNLVLDWTWTQFRWSATPKWLQEELKKFGMLLVNLFPKPQ